MVVEIKQDFWNLVSECPIRGVKCVKFVLKRFLKGFLTLICYQMDFWRKIPFNKKYYQRNFLPQKLDEGISTAIKTSMFKRHIIFLFSLVQT